MKQMIAATYVDANRCPFYHAVAVDMIEVVVAADITLKGTGKDSTLDATEWRPNGLLV